MDEVWRRELDDEARDNVGQQHHAFRYHRTDKVESGRENDNVEDIVDRSYQLGVST